MTDLESLDVALAALSHAWAGLYDAAKAAEPGTPGKAELDAAEDAVWGSHENLGAVRKEMAP